LYFPHGYILLATDSVPTFWELLPTQMVSLFASIYAFVRGCDNIMTGLRNGPRECAEAERILFIDYEFHEGGASSSDIVSGQVDVGNGDRIDAGLELAASGSA
jgi:hypothetical protein